MAWSSCVAWGWSKHYAIYRSDSSLTCLTELTITQSIGGDGVSTTMNFWILSSTIKLYNIEDSLCDVA